jgi:hypothetical protein
MNDGPWQDLKPEQQGHLRHDKMLGVRFPVGPSSGHIGDMSDGDDEDSARGTATRTRNRKRRLLQLLAVGPGRCVNTFCRISFS